MDQRTRSFSRSWTLFWAISRPSEKLFVNVSPKTGGWEGFKKRFSDKIKGNCQAKLMAENRVFHWLTVFRRRHKNVLAEKKEKTFCGKAR